MDIDKGQENRRMTNTDLEKIDWDDYTPLARSQREYYYIFATSQGKRVFLGPYNTEEEANRIGFEKLDGNFECIPLPTRDRSRATGMLKARLLDKSGDLENSLERVKHKT